MAGGAVPAGAADRDVRAGDPVAFLDPCDAGAGRFYDAGALVAADERQARGAGGPDVLVGMAQPGRLEPDEDLAGLGLIQVQLGDFPWLAALAEHRRPGLHHASSGSGSVGAWCGPGLGLAWASLGLAWVSRQTALPLVFISRASRRRKCHISCALILEEVL